MDKRMPLLVKSYLIFLILLIPVTIHSTGFESLRQELHSVPVHERLAFLEDYCQKHMQDEYYREYLHLYEEEAIQANNKQHLGSVLGMLGKYFYPEYIDSLYQTMERLKPIAAETKMHEEYIELWSLYNYSLIWEGKNDEMDKSVNAFKEYSRKANSQKGLELADLNMAYFYYVNKMQDEAEKLYIDILARREKRNSPLIERISVLNQLFHYMSDKEKKEKYLLEAETLIEAFKKQSGHSEEDKNSANIHEFSLHSTYADMLIREKRFEEAVERLERLDSLPTQQSFKDERQIVISQLYYLYYMEQERYDEALRYLDQSESLVMKSNVLANRVLLLETKAYIYTRQKKYEEVVNLQNEIMELKDSINQTNFQESVADVRARYEMDKLELEKQQMEIETAKTRSKMTLLIGGCVLLLLALLGLVVIIRSMQKSRKALREAKEEAENADRMKSAFLANMNHEIRTPLNAIVGFSQLIIEEEAPESKHEFAQIIESNNELLQRLIGDVLDISKIESNSMSLIYREHEVSQIMKELYNSISLRVPETVELILDPCEVITTSTDRNRLVQIITNLLTNAIKHTREGSIRFGFRRQDTGMLYFYVEDTGEGIPTEQVDKIFDRFVQLENGRKGVGLGLAICKGLVTQMGGTIGVTSVNGKGSTFYFTIPIK